MVQGVQSVMKDPKAAMSKLGQVLKDTFADDDSIEAARLQLLNDPEIAGNKAISDMFATEEMKELLNDPEKWRKSVKEGQKMMFTEDEEAGGIGMGEL